MTSITNVAVDALTTLTPPLFTCWPVVTEAAWLLRKRPPTSTTSSEALPAGCSPCSLSTPTDLPAIAAIMRRYEDAGIQFADAALAHLAERENIRTVFTTDRRDFSIIRLKRNRTLKLMPEVQ